MIDNKYTNLREVVRQLLIDIRERVSFLDDKDLARRIDSLIRESVRETDDDFAKRVDKMLPPAIILEPSEVTFRNDLPEPPREEEDLSDHNPYEGTE